MLLEKQMGRLSQLMQDKKVDILALGASSDLEYLTGMSPFRDERFKALFVLQDGRYFYICPQLYYEETRNALGEETEMFVWSDTEGFLTAIEKVNEKYALDNKTIGVNEGIRSVDLLDMQEVTKANFVNGSCVMEELRVIKTENEKNNLRKAAQIADEAMGEILKFIRPSLTEKDIKERLEELLVEKGGQGLSFETIIASGPNSSKPHYIGDSRVIEKKDIIILDFGCKYNGYCSDISRTVFVGEPTDEQKKIYSIVVEANTKGEENSRKGIMAQEIDITARNIIKNANYGEYFINRTGHGIGLDDHEAPYIKEGNKQILEDGMVFSVEPGIYIPGRFGMRVENIVLIENGKAEILNKFTKELLIV